MRPDYDSGVPQPAPDGPLEGAGLPRRAVLGGLTAAALVAAGGCSSGSPRPAAHESAPSDGTTTTPREVSPDVALAITAVGRIGAVADLLHRTVARHRSLRHRLSGLAALHAAHLRLLQDAVPQDRRGGARGATGGHAHVPHREHAALEAVLGAEHALRPRLDGLAVQAQSGEFARLLAAMSAAVGQQLAAVAR